MIQSDGFEILAYSIEPELLEQCSSILPLILANSTYVNSGVTFRQLYKRNPEKFSAIRIEEIDKNDLFIIANPSLDYQPFKNILVCQSLWCFAAKCLHCSINDVAFSFMNITRKPAGFGPLISWHRDFGNKMTSTCSSHNMLRIIIPLNDNVLANGAVAIVPQSHFIEDDLVLARSGIDTEYCQARAEIINLHRGDMLAMDSKLIHGSGINSSRVGRNNLIFQFIIKGSAHFYEDQNEPYYNLGLHEILSSD